MIMRREKSLLCTEHIVLITLNYKLRARAHVLVWPLAGECIGTISSSAPPHNFYSPRVYAYIYTTTQTARSHKSFYYSTTLRTLLKRRCTLREVQTLTQLRLLLWGIISLKLRKIDASSRSRLKCTNDALFRTLGARKMQIAPMQHLISRDAMSIMTVIKSFAAPVPLISALLYGESKLRL